MTTDAQTKTKTTRKIVHIDEDKCDGCGLCVPSCAEGAIQIVDGKAKLLAENLCDGLGNCLGECPKDAIHIEEREADEFDEQAVEEHLASREETEMKHKTPEPQRNTKPQAKFGGCPGSRMMQFAREDKPEAKAPATETATGSRQSQLGHWPVQLTLLPEQGPLWNGANVLLAADCVAYTMADFHEKLLSGRTLAVACPKLDDVEPYVGKLARILAGNDVESVTIARMEVPCCGGLEMIFREAAQRAGVDVPLNVITVSLDGKVKSINGVVATGLM
ncbi:MAG: 4Fe-4S binding protein [Phycisphaerae bacterium]